MLIRSFSLKRSIKYAMPGSLFARAFLIMLLPMILLQLVVLVIFYERHWDSVVRNLSFSASAEISMLVEEYNYMRAEEQQTVAKSVVHMQRLSNAMAMKSKLDTRGTVVVEDGRGQEEFPQFYDELNRSIDAPLMIIPRTDTVRVVVAHPDGMLQFTMSRKRLASSTTYIFVFWMLGSAFILAGVATLFLRNQIRPIVQLARAAEQFGLGRDVENFSPRGASEIRRAGKAFLIMAERIKRQVQTRTDMLSGISHDLRTPLARMMLQVEMSKMDGITQEALKTDITEMRHMIDEYLDFARGDADETTALVLVNDFITELVETYRRQHQPVQFTMPHEQVRLMIRPRALRRCLQNVIDNALRYGVRAEVTLEIQPHKIVVRVVDAGPGIPEDQQEEVFKPFTRLEASRNTQTGGVGLGLAIARDIAQSHGGFMTLENLRDAAGNVHGLCVHIVLPRES